MVPPASPARDVAGLLAWLRAHPGEANYGSAGNGSAQHLGAELLKAMAQVPASHIPYRGNPTALTDLAAGRLSFVIESMASTLPMARAGTLRALGVSAAARVALAPDVPPIAETVPGYEAYTWNAILAPTGAPEAAITGMNAAMVQVMAEPGVAARLQELGLVPRPGLGPAGVDAFLATEAAKWQPLMRVAGVRAD
jgi:tripartite-type tricarboxylate transporter receptor subunit TctC